MSPRTRMITLIFLSSVCFLVLGCSSSPPEDVIKEGLFLGTQVYYPSKQGAVVLDKYTITNKYTKQINGENVYIYEASFKCKEGPNFPAKIEENEKQILFSTFDTIFGAVKRGEKWYLIRMN